MKKFLFLFFSLVATSVFAEYEFRVYLEIDRTIAGYSNLLLAQQKAFAGDDALYTLRTLLRTSDNQLCWLGMKASGDGIKIRPSLFPYVTRILTYPQMRVRYQLLMNAGRFTAPELGLN